MKRKLRFVSGLRSIVDRPARWPCTGRWSHAYRIGRCSASRDRSRPLRLRAGSRSLADLSKHRTVEGLYERIAAAALAATTPAAGAAAASAHPDPELKGGESFGLPFDALR